MKPEAKKIYTVHAYRYGDREKHSYIVGVYKRKLEAVEIAKREEDYRGGKYDCEIREFVIGTNFEEGYPGMPSKIIKRL